MKRRIYILAILITILLIGCEGKKPDNLSTGTYNACKKIIECTDEYIRMDITYKEFSERYDEAKSRMEDNTVEDTVARSQATSLMVMVSTNNLSSKTSIDDIIEKRNEFAEYLGLSKYKQQ